MAHDIFLSYSRKDSAMKDRVQKTLEDSGLRVWTDANLTPGTPEWEWAITQAIKECPGLVVLMSTDSYKSEWVLREITAAQERRKDIFPILVAGTEDDAVPLRLNTYQRIDMRDDRRYTSEMVRLIDAIKQNVSIPFLPLTETSRKEPSTTNPSQGSLTEKHRQADVRLLYDLWECISTNDVDGVIAGVFNHNLMEKYFNKTFSRYLYTLRRKTENHFINVGLEAGFNEFDKVLNEFIDQLWLEETVELIRGQLVFVPAYISPQLRNQDQESVVYMKNLKAKETTDRFGQEVLKQHQALVMTIKQIMPEFTFPTSSDSD